MNICIFLKSRVFKMEDPLRFTERLLFSLFGKTDVIFQANKYNSFFQSIDLLPRPVDIVEL